MKRGLAVAFMALLIVVMPICGQHIERCLRSQYVDMLDDSKEMLSINKEYGLVSSRDLDQSAILQHALDDISIRGGGSVIIEQGVYKFSNVYMASNVHLLVEPETVFLPVWGASASDKVAMLIFSGERSNIKKSDIREPIYIENCSIRCSVKGARYRVDYSDKPSVEGWGVRFIIASMVRNFLIADFKVIDNYTTYCAICCSPTRSTNRELVKDWEISRPTNGEIRNCSIYNATPGYGLVQCHGAQSLYFENLYAKGGVTLRLETGANSPYIGVYDIMARNLVSEDGRSAIMFGPHISKNGRVTADSILSKGSLYAVSVGAGFTNGKHKNDKGATKGSFSNDSRITNIHAIYGEKAQLKEMNLYKLPIELQSWVTPNNDIYPVGKWLTSPSSAAVVIDRDAGYTITVEGVTQDGFKYRTEPVVMTQKEQKKR